MDFIALRFTGSDVRPGNTRCREVAAVIQAMEDLVDALTEDLEDENGNPIGGSLLSLTDIEDRSLGMKFKAAHMAIALAAWHNFGMIVTHGRFDLMSAKVRDSFEEIVTFVKRRNCNLELRDSRHDEPIAQINPSIKLPKAFKVTSNSSLIGDVVRVGGADPKVGLRLADGKVLSCETTETIAKELGHRLYETVSCRGVATWDVNSTTLLKFKISSVTEFKRGRASEGFVALAGVMVKTAARWEREGFEVEPEE